MRCEGTAIYAGSFDPPTLGHLWVIGEGLRLFGRVTVVVGGNPAKQESFSIDERVGMVREATRDLGGVEVLSVENRYLHDLARDPEAVELAIWFHDAVHDPMARDNEEQSAALARRAGMGKHVEDLILATRHDRVPVGRDERILVDVDLSILGQPESRYDEYEERIRIEYRAVPEARFNAGRAAILRSFLERSWIYATDSFRERYEERARRNLGRSLQRLG